jgi:acetyl-CoA synthetase
MIERFLTQTHFTSTEDYKKNLHFIIPENFNFAYDVMDVWAEEKPDKLALLWTNNEGECIRFTFKDLKEQSDQTASYFQSLGIGRGDMVMLILKRRYEFWLAMMALHKLGAVAIPATHMLTDKDIVYRNNRASIKAIICVDDKYVMEQVKKSEADSPSLKVLIGVGDSVHDEFHDWRKEWKSAPKIVRPEHVNSNEDTMLMYFTSGTEWRTEDGHPRFPLRNGTPYDWRILA